METEVTEAMVQAANLLLVDNAGYTCDDEAREIAERAAVKLRPETVGWFSAWWAGLNDAQREVVTMGEDVTEPEGLPTFTSGEQPPVTLVVLPLPGQHVLNTLFECL